MKKWCTVKHFKYCLLRTQCPVSNHKGLEIIPLYACRSGHLVGLASIPTAPEQDHLRSRTSPVTGTTKRSIWYCKFLKWYLVPLCKFCIFCSNINLTQSHWHIYMGRPINLGKPHVYPLPCPPASKSRMQLPIGVNSRNSLKLLNGRFLSGCRYKFLM